MSGSVNGKAPVTVASVAKAHAERIGVVAKAPVVAETGSGVNVSAVKNESGKNAQAKKVSGEIIPSKVTSGKKATAKKIVGPTVAVFVDVDNANASRDNLLEVFTHLRTQGTVTYGKLYGLRFDKAGDYDEIVAENRLESVGRMRFKHGEDSVVDTRLVVDCIIAAESGKFDSIFVWAGVGDLMSLFAHIKQLGCKVIAVDLPAFDSANKFVDKKIKLFSPHTLNKPAPVAAVAAYSAAVPLPTASSHVGGGSAPKASLPNSGVSASVIAGKDIPSLPRKAGAPEFGRTGAAVVQDSFGAIADDVDDFNVDELEDLDDTEDDVMDEDLVADEFIDDPDLDDFDDLGDDDDVFEGVDTDSDVLDEDENAKLLALSTQMLRDMKQGKEFNAKEAAVKIDGYGRDSYGDLGAGFDDLGSGVGDIRSGHDVDENKSKNTYFSAGTQYDLESSGEVPDDRIKPDEEGTDEFTDFGNL